jgi:hypothetical protein
MEAVEIVARRVLVAASVVLEPYTSVGAALIAHSVVGFSGSSARRDGLFTHWTLDEHASFAVDLVRDKNDPTA